MSFINNFTALSQGESAEQTAKKAQRAAESALKSQIASLEGDTIQLEDLLAEATEKEANALVNFGKSITNRNDYVSNLIRYRNEKVEAEENLKAHSETIELLKGHLENIK